MGWQLPSRVGFLTLVFSLLLCLMAANGQNASGVSVKLLDTPFKYTENTTAAFSFAMNGACGCSDRTMFICQLDGFVFSDCDTGKETYFDLADGNHTFEVGINGSYKGLLDSASYNWTIDADPPTAEVRASTRFTHDLNVSVDIFFLKPCSFVCFAVDSCNLKVQGPGEVIPSSLKVVKPNRQYKLLVSLAANVEYGQVNLSMGEGICVDDAGRKFTPTPKSTVLVKFDRRNVSSGLSSHIPAKRFEFNSEVVEVEATNNQDDLKFNLYFSQPVVNTSAQILNALNTSEGTLVEGDGRNQTFFPFMITNVSSSSAIITVRFESHSIKSREGIAVSPIAPFTFLYDVERPNVWLNTSTFRTREDNISISIHFAKPVLNFSSSDITISGGHRLSFHTVEDLMIYTIEVKFDDDWISVKILENTTEDLAGNKNLPSNLLVVRHDYTSAFSDAVAIFATTSVLVNSVVVGLLSVSTANLQVSGALPSSGCMMQPLSNLFRMLYYIQGFALSGRLMETPNAYNELTRSLQWSIPHYSLPWEGGKEHIPPSSGISKTILSIRAKQTLSIPANLLSMIADSVKTLKNINGRKEMRVAYSKEEETGKDGGWKKFNESMLPLAIITGSTLLVHCLLVLFLRKKKSTEKSSDYGMFTFPIIEIFLLGQVLAAVCQGSAILIHGGTPSGYVVASILLAHVLYVLLALLLFYLVCATKQKLLQYKEEDVRQEEGQQFDFFCRLILGPGKKGQWTWKGQADSVYLTMFGPLFEDFRGPPSQILDASRRGRFITFKNATWKMLQSLSIYYTLVDWIKRVCLGLMAGDYLRNCVYTAPATTMLCINSFQLFFLVVGKPFIERTLQLINIISVASEVGLYASGVALQKRHHKDDSKTGYLMVVLFLVGILAQLANVVYRVYNMVKKLDHPDGRCFFKGSKVAMKGLLSFFTFSSSTPQPEAVGIEALDPEKEAEAGPSYEGNSKSSFSKSKKTTDPLAVAPLEAIPNPEDAKSTSKVAEEPIF